MDLDELIRLREITVNELLVVNRGLKNYGEDYKKIIELAKERIEMLINEANENSKE